MAMPGKSLSIVLPCLNEVETIGICVEKARRAIAELGRPGEVIVADNGSTDGSRELAAKLGARVVEQPVKGYGAAYLKGLEAAQGDQIVMGDSDDTYDFLDLARLIRELDAGADMVIGSRFRGTILPGAMSFSHRYIGNPILSGILNLFFGARISDCHSGFRAFTRDAVRRLHLSTLGMEFASEMIVSALRNKLRIVEVPITYHPRKGESKLESLSDAWRHMRFMLLFSPNWLFLLPGLVLFGGGLTLFLNTAMGWLRLFGHVFDIHAMIFFAMFTLAGFQVLATGLFAKAFAVREGFTTPSRLLEGFFRIFDLERALFWGSLLFAGGFAGSAYIVGLWVKIHFVGYFLMPKQSLFCVVMMIMGLQTIFSAFFISLLRLPSIPRNP
jgi:glycosyltransferase involved in cell wall biosynthesis